MYFLPRGMVLVLLLTIVSPAWAGRGIEITADKTGRFEYTDDFSTPRFFADAVSVTVAPSSWQPGAITNSGPQRGEVVWRFYGGGRIRDSKIEVAQKANGRSLGGVNHLYLSSNGLDWMKVASSSDQTANAGGWQDAPFIVDGEAAKPLLKSDELWIKMVLSNHSGLKTNPSNYVNHLKIGLSLDKPRPSSASTNEPVAAIWRDAGHKALIIDSTNTAAMPPLYLESADRWLSPWKVEDAKAGKSFEMQRKSDPHFAARLSAAVFLQTRKTNKPLAVRVAVRSSRDSTRKMTVGWDGKLLGTFDAANFFENTTTFDIVIPGPHAAGAHELRIGTDDLSKLRIQRISVTGDESLAFTDKPKLSKTQPLRVLAAYFMPDHRPPADSQVAEGRQKVAAGITYSSLQQMHKQYAEFGALRIDVKNQGKNPIRISGLTLNGRPVDAHHVDFAKSDWDARGVVWHRIHPQTVAAGKCAEVYVRFRRRPEGKAARVVIETENAGALTQIIPYIDPDLAIDYITTDRSQRKLIAYVKPHSEKSKPATITSATLDGEPLAKAKIFDEKMASGTALITALLPEKLRVGDYHVFGVTTASGDHRTAEFRVLPFEFPRSSIHVPSEICKEMHMNLLMWNARSLEECEKYDVATTAMGIFDPHDRVRYILGPDEPDAHDNLGGGYDRGLGLTARHLADSRRLAMIERFAPGRPWWVIMNGTTRPLNWCVYGQMADIASFDPYPVNFYGADHASVRESLLYARRSGAPRRLFACMEAFGWSKGQGVPLKSRGPTPEEYRQNIVQAIGSGMKGLTSWVYSSGAGGWQLNDACRKEIARMNTLIEAIESDLLIATPVDWARSDAGKVKTGVVGEERWEKDRVWVGALIAGPDTIILAAVNHIPASMPDPPVITPAENVTVTVDLPPYLRDVTVAEVTAAEVTAAEVTAAEVTATEVTDAGEKAYPCEIRDGKAILKLDLLKAGRVFVLRRKVPDAKGKKAAAEVAVVQTFKEYEDFKAIGNFVTDDLVQGLSPDVPADSELKKHCIADTAAGDATSSVNPGTSTPQFERPWYFMPAQLTYTFPQPCDLSQIRITALVADGPFSPGSSQTAATTFGNLVLGVGRHTNPAGMPPIRRSQNAISVVFEGEQVFTPIVAGMVSSPPRTLSKGVWQGVWEFGNGGVRNVRRLQILLGPVSTWSSSGALTRVSEVDVIGHESREPPSARWRFVPAVDRKVTLRGYCDPVRDGAVELNWSVSGADFTCEARRCRLRFAASSGSQYWVKIDGAPYRMVKAEPVIDLTPMFSNSNLTRHCVSVIKKTEPDSGVDVLLGIETDPKGRLLPVSPAKKPRILFLGDSITVGMQSPKAGQTDVRSTFAWIIGKQFDADVRILAESGIGVHRGWRKETFIQKWERMCSIQKKAASLGASPWIPDMIVVNLGTNDSSRGVDGKQVAAAMHKLLLAVADTYPDATTVVMTPWTYGCYRGELRQVVAQLRKERSTTKFHFIDADPAQWVVKGGMSDNTHPNLLGHQIAAEKLVRELATITRWQPSTPHSDPKR